MTFIVKISEEGTLLEFMSHDAGLITTLALLSSAVAKAERAAIA